VGLEVFDVLGLLSDIEGDFLEDRCPSFGEVLGDGCGLVPCDSGEEFPSSRVTLGKVGSDPEGLVS